MTEKITEKYITIQTVAERLSCTDNHVYELIREGKLLAVKIGERALRVSETSYADFIADNVINPEDYFAPTEPTPDPESQKPKIARSNWMNNR